MNIDKGVVAKMAFKVFIALKESTKFRSHHPHLVSSFICDSM